MSASSARHAGTSGLQFSVEDPGKRECRCPGPVRNALLFELTFEVLVPVEAELGVVREIGAELQKEGPKSRCTQLGCSFHATRNSAIACSRSSTLWNESRRTRLLVNLANQRSIRLNLLELVGTKWGTKRGSRPGQGANPGVLVSPVVVHHQVQRYRAGKFLI
jgi:hypothetical protein